MKYIVCSGFSFLLFIVFIAETSFILLNEDSTKIGNLDFRTLLIIHSSLLSIVSFFDMIKYILYYKKSKKESSLDRYINYPNY